MCDMGTLYSSSSSVATGINILGQVVGDIFIGKAGHRAFIYSNGQMRDIFSGEANAINIQGQVVGYADLVVNNAGERHAFIYSNGQMRDIGTLLGSSTNSVANRVNNRGQVVGNWSRIDPEAESHAFIYSNGQMRDLTSLLPPSSTWTLTNAADINEAGQIIGAGFSSNGQSQHAFLMTPR
jgi:probable HAF family extracellular repeat protein